MYQTLHKTSHRSKQVKVKRHRHYLIWKLCCPPVYDYLCKYQVLRNDLIELRIVDIYLINNTINIHRQGPHGNTWLFCRIFTWELMSYLRYLSLFTYNDVQHILCCGFVLFLFVLCTLCYKILWIVRFDCPFTTWCKDQPNIVFIQKS
jgi:hypothetical protein